MRSVTEGQRTEEEVRPGSDRNFGLVMAAAAAILGCLPLLRLAAPHWWLIGVAVAFAAFALVLPRALFPLNYRWFRLGLLLHRVISPVILGAVFFLCVTPTRCIAGVGDPYVELSWSRYFRAPRPSLYPGAYPILEA